MVVKAFVDMRSQPSRALIIFLRNTDIPFEIETIDLHKGQTRTPEFRKINPLGTVPAIQDGDFFLAETVAIIRYLVGKYGDKVADHWYPADPERRARVDEYLSWHETGTRAACCDLFISEVLHEQIFGKPVTEEKLQDSKENLKTQLDKLERAFLTERDFVAGNKISVADLLVVCEIMQNTVNDRDVTEGRPLLKAYVQRVRDRLDSPLFDEIHATMKSLYH